jgi:hypothetical protein
MEYKIIYTFSTNRWTRNRRYWRYLDILLYYISDYLGMVRIVYTTSGSLSDLRGIRFDYKDGHNYITRDSEKRIRRDLDIWV